MTRSTSPAFQFYPDDFMGGKPGMMTAEQTHVYIWLLCLDWNQHGFPFDVPMLARWCRVSPAVLRKAWLVVQECFSSREGRWFNERLEKERTKQAEWREKSAKGGRTKRQPNDNHPSAVSPTKYEPKGNTPVSSLQFPTPVTTNSIADSVESEWPASWAYDTSQRFLSHSVVLPVETVGKHAKLVKNALPWSEWQRVVDRMAKQGDAGYGYPALLRRLKDFRDVAQPDPNRDLSPEEAMAL